MRSYFWHVAAHFFHHVVLGVQAFGHAFVRQVGDEHQQLLERLFRFAQAVVQRLDFVFQHGGLGFGLARLGLFALLEEHAYLLGKRVHFSRLGIHLRLGGLARVVQFHNPGDDFGPVEMFFGQTLDDVFRILCNVFQR